MERRITAAALILLAGCGGKVMGLFDGSGRSLNYAQYRSLEAGMRADAIQKAFGPAKDVLEQEGKLRGLAYACEDPSGKVLELRMVFSADGRLAKWVLRDPKAPEPPEPPPAAEAAEPAPSSDAPPPQETEPKGQASAAAVASPSPDAPPEPTRRASA